MSDQWVQVSRDIFAREDIERLQVPATLLKPTSGCDECDGRNGYRGLFQYRINTDGGRKNEIVGRFCSINCMRSYHG